MDQVVLGKKKGRKRLKRRREIQGRWRCHGDTDRCAIAHPPKKKPAIKIEAKHATYYSPIINTKKTWIDSFKDKVKTLLRNMTEFISRGPKSQQMTKTFEDGSDS